MRLVFCLALTLAACALEAPAEPAPEDDRAIVSSDESTTQDIESIPRVDGVQLPTLSPEQAENARQSEAADEGRSFGPIIGPDHQPPPTSTPHPTQAPTAVPIVLPPTLPRSAAVTPFPRDQTRLDPAQMGIQAHYNYDVAGWGAVMFHAAALRMGWVKVQAAWEWLQPKGAGQFDQNFRLFQIHVQEADKRGFQVMLSLVKAPDWARHIDRNEDGPPDDLNNLVWFIQMLLEKVGPYIDAIEIWNEPNLKREWTGGRPISGASYMELFAAAYNAIRAYSPYITKRAWRATVMSRSVCIPTVGAIRPISSAAIISMGKAGTITRNSFSSRLLTITAHQSSPPTVWRPLAITPAFQSRTAPTCAGQMYQAGLARYSDVKIGVHPYSWGPISSAAIISPSRARLGSARFLVCLACPIFSQ